MWSWHIGTIRGIELKIHITFPLILLWVIFQFGRQGDGNQSAIFFGLVVVLLLFGCILLHELGHALVAQRYGVTVSEILLLPIGGLARLRAMNDDPWEELWIAAAGPLVNVLIVLLLFPVLLILLLLQSDLVLTAELLSPATLWGLRRLVLGGQPLLSFTRIVDFLILANLMLVIFNLIPAFPMDGGRILRAGLALFLRYHTATVVAVRLAQVVAVGFLLLGVQGNLGLVLIALFVFFSGSQELQRVALREVLAKGQIERYMMRDLYSLFPQWSVYSVRLLAQQTGQRAFPVVEGGRLLGLLTVREMHAHAPSSTVREAMLEEFPILLPGGTLYDAQVALLGQDRFAGAVMEGGALLGLLSLEDIERAYHSLRRQPRTKVA